MSFIELLLIAVGLSMDAFAVAACAGLTMVKVNVRKALIIGLYFGVFQAVMPLIGYAAAALFADKINRFDHWIAFALLSFLGVKMIIGSLKKDGGSGKERPGESVKKRPGNYGNERPGDSGESCPSVSADNRSGNYVEKRSGDFTKDHPGYSTDEFPGDTYDKEPTAGDVNPGNAEASVKAAQMFPLALATSIDALAVGVSFAFLHVNIVPAVLFIGATTLLLSILGVKIGCAFGAKFKSKAEFCGGVILALIGFKILFEHLGIIQF